MEEQEIGGTVVAPLPSVARRIGAMFAILVLLILAALLIWRVYLHHERSNSIPDEPALVFLAEKFANDFA